MEKLKMFKHWAVDYLYALHGHAKMFLMREPAHYRGLVVQGKSPIILIPGITAKWHMMNLLADPLSKKGHPVYIVPRLGFNFKKIGESAKIIRELIDENDLRDVIILAHSKGGLIGKYVLAHHNGDNRVKKLIAIATPFAGSRLAVHMPSRWYEELRPDLG